MDIRLARIREVDLSGSRPARLRTRGGDRWHDTKAIVRASGLLDRRAGPILAAFYVLTIATALFDGVGLVLLMNLMTGNVASAGQADVVTATAMRFLQRLGGRSDAMAVLFFIVALFAVRAAMTFAVQGMESALNAYIRRRIQERGFASVLRGDWEVLRDMRVGQRVGAITEESTIVAKYLISIVRTTYAFLTGAVLLLIAALVSAELTTIMVVTAVPAMAILRWLFGRVSRLSREQVGERQGFVADITERLNALFHIKVEGQPEGHIVDGLRHQHRLTSLETRIGMAQAGITAFNILLPSIVLLEFSAWFALRGLPFTESMNLLASVGIVGARAAAQFNSAEASLGNISRLSGSLAPVAALFGVRAERPFALILEPLRSVVLVGVTYRYTDSAGVTDANFTAQVGRPFLIKGPSGSGKTTLANLIAGVYRPQAGTVTYTGSSGRAYSSSDHRPAVGYVTQDIHLFHGSIRQNLASRAEALDDDWLWTCLERSGAANMVRAAGGLDAVIAEAGRSLSGGERRRLGIARVLVQRPSMLILDEVTAGLDDANRRGIVQTIQDLSKDLVVFIISHDPLELPFSDEWNFAGASAPVQA